MAPGRLLLSLLGPLLLLSHSAYAHGAHDEQQADWATQHLAGKIPFALTSPTTLLPPGARCPAPILHPLLTPLTDEHHISNFDGGAFFQLHDFDDNGYWDFDEIYTTYGLKHESTNHIEKDRKDSVIRQVLSLLDRNQDGQVTKEEWMAFVAGGGKLPDFGMGPGHHGDDEYEYEIHHWEK